MQSYQMGAVEAKFADIIWKNEPISSTELSKQGEKILGWKKSTTYTVLKRLCDKKLFKNENGTVISLISKEEFYSMQTERFVEDTFNGSLPAFLAAFTARKGLSAKEIDELKRIISEYEEE